MRHAQLTERLKLEAGHLGFELTGCCAAAPSPRLKQFRQWLQAGHAGTMDYIGARRAAYEDPQYVLEGVRSILMLGMNYWTKERGQIAPGHGKVSCYAWGDTDYHDLIHDRLKVLVQFLRQEVPEASVRGVVDTAPLLERDYANLAGLGWIGKNTLLLNQQYGSFFFLAALLTDVELEYDEPFATDHCGSCRACLEACPTSAFPKPYVLDATRCISYLTIELREAIEEPLREGLADWVFGCDVCQDVCPWNHRVGASEESAFSAAETLDPVDLPSLFQLDDTEFRALFKQTPLWRTRRRGLLRNAAIVLGNQRAEFAREALRCGLHDEEKVVRGASAWALGKLNRPSDHELLRHRLTLETDKDVRREIQKALGEPST